MTDREKFIVLVDNDCVKKSDAIILLEGDGLNRCAKAIELYRSGLANIIVFSGGITDYSYGSISFSEVLPMLLDNNIPIDVIIHEKNSLNTKEQATEVIKLADNYKWKKLILVASHYHQYRAYLTFLRSILNVKSDIILYNAPADNLLWFLETGWGKRFDLLEQEFSKIEKYSAIGQLITFEEVTKYQIWKEQQA